MSDENTTDLPKPRWLLTLMRAQIFNRDAETMGKGPWWLFAVVVLLTTLLTAFPFVNDKQRTAIESTNPSLYPGLVTVFQEIEKAGWELRVEKGVLVTGKDVPAQVRFGKWLVVVEPAGGSQEVLSSAFGSSSGTADQKIVFFGRSHFGVLDQSTNRQFDGTYELLAWFGPEAMKKVGAQELLTQFLFMAATAGLAQVQASVTLLMFVQIVFLVVLLGFLLSLSKVQVRGLGVNSKRAAGFISSLKTAGAVTLGPALLLAVVLSALPGSGSISWVGFTLFFGVRIIVIYMARFRNKKQAQ